MGCPKEGSWSHIWTFRATLGRPLWVLKAVRAQHSVSGVVVAEVLGVVRRFLV
jgi:hypothetical protein